MFLLLGYPVWTSNSYVNVTLIPPRCADPILHIPVSIPNLFECCNILVMIRWSDL